jgi:serine/threonine-protein kinase
MGSPVYMSPEQMRSGRDAVIASDVWALGVMLQELLTQQLPFDGESMPELCLKVVAGEPRSPLLDRPDLPRVVVDIIERCLQKEPSARFNDAGKVAAALRPLVSPSMLTVADRAAQLTEATHVDGAAMRASVPPRSSEQSSVVPSSAYLPPPQVVSLPDGSRRSLEAAPAIVSTGGGTTLPPPPPSMQSKGSSWRPIGAALALALVAAALLLAFRTGASSAVTALPTASASTTLTAPTAIPPASAAAPSSAVATPETTAAPPATKSAEPEPAATTAGATRPKPVKTAATGASVPPPTKTGATPGDEIPAFR